MSVIENGAGAATVEHGGNPGAEEGAAPVVAEPRVPAQQADANGAGNGLKIVGTEFLSALAAGVEQKSPTGDPHVSVAFALGWQMAELYRPADHPTQPPERGEDLPGFGELSANERALVGLDQVDVALRKLGGFIADQGIKAPTTEKARDALAADPANDAFRKELFDLHVALLAALTAADFKLGKAYGLGRSLSDTCRKPKDLASMTAELERHRVATLMAWMADLTTAFPPHAGHSVGDSLKAWRDWAADANAPGRDDAGRAVRLLRRQGERWRALLSGEKHGGDLLELQDYVSAGAGVLARLGSLTWRFLLRFLPAVIVVLALAAGGVVLILTDSNSGGHVAAGLAGLLAAGGLTWKGVGASLGSAAAKAERPVWEAQLDAAITQALTLLPGSKRVKGFVPPNGAAR